MDKSAWNAGDEAIPTAILCDACVRLDAPFQLASRELRPVSAGMWCCGKARPVRHSGGVDAFLATLNDATAGEILVIDNAGRSDEGCVGELLALEAAAAGIGGLVIWGCHRDTSGLIAIDLPVFSLGACPVGPRRLSPAPDNPSPAVIIGSAIVQPGDVVAADGDGLIVIAPDHFAGVLPVAREIQQSEHVLADVLADGQTLREQWQFDAYLALRRTNPNYTFRDHMGELHSRRPA